MRTTQEWKSGRIRSLRNPVLLVAFVFAILASVVVAQQAQQAQAPYAREAPQLFELLELRPGMSVGEIGAGGGEMTVELARRLGPSGHVFSTELDAARLADIRAAVAKEGLTNVTVIEAGEVTTNLPAGCCDAVFMRDVYHHITKPAEIARSINAALKPGGRVAIIDFEPTPGSETPAGLPADREGHGVRPETIVAEISAAGPMHVRTIRDWSVLRANRSLFAVVFKK
jgi:precorrin-6B methylase 2